MTSGPAAHTAGIFWEKIVITKRCNCCHQEKPLSEFHRRVDRPSHAANCKACHNAKSRVAAALWRLKNKQKIRAINQKYNPKRVKRSTMTPDELMRLTYAGQPLFVQSEIGLEKLCKVCMDYWPADTEFFWKSNIGAGGIFDICKCCAREARLPRSDNLNPAIHA